MEVLKVSSKSEPGKLAGAIAGYIRENKKIEIQAVGAGALNQAIKGIAIAKGFLAPTGKEILCDPYFEDVVIEDQEKTAIKIKVIVTE